MVYVLFYPNLSLTRLVMDITIRIEFGAVHYNYAPPSKKWGYIVLQMLVGRLVGPSVRRQTFFRSVTKELVAQGSSGGWS